MKIAIMRVTSEVKKVDEVTMSFDAREIVGLVVGDQDPPDGLEHVGMFLDGLRVFGGAVVYVEWGGLEKWRLEVVE